VLVFRKKFSTALTFSASAIALAPSSTILLPRSSSSVTTALTFSASAIALAPIDWHHRRQWRLNSRLLVGQDPIENAFYGSFQIRK